MSPVPENPVPAKSTEGTLWDQKFFRFNKEEIQARSAFQEWLRVSGNRLGLYLADVREDSPAGGFDREDVRELEKLIVRSCVKKADALLPLHIVSKVVYRLNRSFQKSIPQPRLAFLMKREKNPFVDENAEAHRSVHDWLKAERNWIESLSPMENEQVKSGKANVPVELVIFSAALHGGILSVDSAVALFEGLRRPTEFFHCSSSQLNGQEIRRVYADLSIAWQGVADQEVRRWYPDETLVCLIARISNSFVEQGEKMAEQRAPESEAARRDAIAEELCLGINKEFERQDAKRQEGEPIRRPGSLKEMLARIEKVMRSEIPAILVEYSACRMDSRSLLPSSIGRIYGDPAVRNQTRGAVPPTEREVETELSADDPEAYDGERPGDLEPEWLPAVRSAFRSSDRLKILASLTRVHDASSSETAMQQRISAFAMRLLEKGSLSGNRLEISSVKCCVLTVGRRFGRMIGNADPVSLPARTLETMYMQVLELAAQDSKDPRRLQRTVGWALREFHGFLVLTYGAPYISGGEVFPSLRGLLSVDARIVSIDDVFAVLDNLEVKYWEQQSPKLKGHYKIAQAEVIFSFFGGLRRMEGLGLRSVDYLGGRLAPVLVRANELRQLKTSNATRWVPIGVLAHPFPQVFKYIDPWYPPTGKQGELVNGDSLFENVSDDIIIPIVHDALQEVTGDSCHLHLLRHSMATWALMRLLLAELPEIPNLFPALPLTTRWLEASKKFRALLYGSDSVMNNHAWAAATLLGHSSPEISRTYIHCLDILTPLFLKRSGIFGNFSDWKSGPDPKLKSEDEMDRDLRIAGGHPQSTAYSWFPRIKPLKPVSAALETPIPHDRPCICESEDEAPTPTDEVASGLPLQAIPASRASIREQFAARCFWKRFKEGAPVESISH